MTTRAQTEKKPTPEATKAIHDAFRPSAVTSMVTQVTVAH